MADEGRTATCCLRATDEEYEEEPEAFDCEGCDFRQHEARLTTHDRLAFRTYRLLQTSAVRDLKLTPLVLEALQLRDEPVAEVLLLLEKLDLIHAHATGGKEVDLGARDE